MACKMAEMLLISLLLNYTGVILNSQCSEADKCFEITMMKSFSIKVRFVPSDQYVSLNSSDCKKKNKNKNKLVNSVLEFKFAI